jgi:hypothetical protein
MKRLAIALLLATAPAAVASPHPARDDAPAPVAPGTPAAAPQLAPPGAVAPVPPPPASNPDEYQSTWLLQTVLGSLAGGVGAVGGIYLGYHLECRGQHCQDLDGIRGAFFGGCIGLSAATTAVVYALGTDDDHDDSVVMTWLGTVAGGALGVLGASRVADAGWFPVTAVITTSAAFGATTLFQVSRTRKKAGAQLQLAPFASGGSFGLSLVGTTR